MAFGQSAAAAPILDDSAQDSRREFAFSDADFKFLSQLAYEHAGIVLSEAKRNLVYGRLSRRLRILKLNTFREYREYITGEDAEVQNFINSISTNHTKLFRESHHFDHFRAHVVKPLAQNAQSQRLRIWSAGCSSGEEPYTIAAVIARDVSNLGRHDVRMLATDIDTDILTKAARGEFSVNAVEDVPKEYEEFFPLTESQNTVMVPEQLRSMIAFRQLNLLGPWPLKGLFDVIFCRNVMIYFDKPTQRKLLKRFHALLEPNGLLFVGHSEALLDTNLGFQSLGQTIYRRKAAAP